MWNTLSKVATGRYGAHAAGMLYGGGAGAAYGGLTGMFGGDRSLLSRPFAAGIRGAAYGMLGASLGGGAATMGSMAKAGAAGWRVARGAGGKGLGVWEEGLGWAMKRGRQEASEFMLNGQASAGFIGGGITKAYNNIRGLF